MNPLVQLGELGQSPWYDYIRRGLISSGDLKELIDNDGLKGVTSNPAIFEKAIAGSTDYDPSLKQIASDVTSVKEIYETLATRDIQDAADLMLEVYEATDRHDGYVSFEVSPDLAFDTAGTIEEAIRLHKAVSRENVLIKVPATDEGVPAIEHLLSQGININVTLLFSVKMYEKVAWAYISGLEKLAASGGDLSKASSVASFFISRVDSLIDGILEEKLKSATRSRDRASLRSLMGKVAIANAKYAYHCYSDIFSSDRFKALERKGAKAQRLLWASTGTKNPKYPDTYYVDELIGPNTVNTMPADTYNAFRDHGQVRPALLEGLDEAFESLELLADCGIDIETASDELLKDGAKKFVDAFEQLMHVIGVKREELLGKKLDRQTFSLAGAEDSISTKLEELHGQNFIRRLWAKDPSLWHDESRHQQIIRNALGWLHAAEYELDHIDRIKNLATEIRDEGFKHLLLLGMGGSSLCPEVCAMTYGDVEGRPELLVLDSTVPAQVRAIESKIDLEKTLCIVSSKSGTTSEPLAFYHYFFNRMEQVKGDRAGENFIAITDPGSFLEHLADESRFRDVIHGDPSIGGRYSALSNFGVVPAALMGVEIEHFLYRAERMRHSCDSCIPPEDNPGMVLGVLLGEMAKQGRDKLTFITSPAVSGLGAWLEQLIAESTGKEGKGIIPIDDEPLGDPDAYGSDRLFAYIRSSDTPDTAQDAAVEMLQKAGQPVVRIEMTELINLGEEFFRWEIATAVAGAVLGINAFDQPNVQESKDNTKAFLEEYKKTGSLPEADPFLESDGIRFYADEGNIAVLNGDGATLGSVIAAHLGRVQEGDYVALNAYLERNDATYSVLKDIRTRIRDSKKVATTLGYGPRFLHSTGQLHKGGPNSGVFLQITADDSEDLPIPDEPFTFGVLKDAQALGDFQSLSRNGRRALRIHLSADIGAGLSKLREAIEEAL